MNFASLIISIALALWAPVSMIALFSLVEARLEMTPEEQTERPLIVWVPLTFLLALVLPLIMVVLVLLLAWGWLAAWLADELPPAR